MKQLRNAFLFTFLFSVLAAVSSFSQEIVDENAPRLTPEQRAQIRVLNREVSSRVEMVASKDPEYKALMADIRSLSAIKNARTRHMRIRAIREKYAVYREAVIKRAGIDTEDIRIRLKRIIPAIRFASDGKITRAMAAGPPVDDKVSFENVVFNAGSVTQTWLIYNDSFLSMKGGGSIHSLGKKSIYISTYTGMFNADRDVILSLGRTMHLTKTFVKEISVEAHVDSFILDTDAVAAFFAYADAAAAVGIRVEGPSQEALQKGTPGLVSFRHARLESEWSVLGGTGDNYSESGSVMKAVFHPINGTGNFRVHVYGRSISDTDGAGTAESLVDLKGITKFVVKITF